MPSRLEPKLVSIFKEGYTTKQFSSDLIAGMVVGIVALPLAIAFAIASGVKPEQGLYTAIIAGIAVAVLGGSRAQISGPTGAFIVVIYGIVAQYGYQGLAVATLIAGVLLIVMGFARMGVLLRFIPYPVTVGFTSGIALIIFSSQIKDFLGLNIPVLPADFIEKWWMYGEVIRSVNFYAVGIGVGSLFVITLWPLVTHRIPGSLVAIILSTLVVQFFHLPAETIGSRFGDVPNTFPAFGFPELSWELITKMFSPAITIALLAGIESLLSAVVADGMLGTRHRSNMELVAQGVGNVLSPLFGGIPATGAIARTATNIKNGGRTPVSAIIHGLTLLVITLFFGKWAALIPMPTLAAILIVVAYDMSERHAFLKTVRGQKSDAAILLTTFFLTVLIDLTVAIEVGVVLAAFLFLRQMASVTNVELITKDLEEREDEDPDDPKAITTREVPPGVEVFEVYGSLFYAAIDQFKDAMRQVENPPKVLILRTRNLLAIDASGEQALEDLLKRTKKDGIILVISGIHKQPLFRLSASGLMDKIGVENVCGDIDQALERARAILLKQGERL
ncbi:MAG: sulfate permease [Ignavibacteriae bacterium]|nr:sulfate permease [Ignavibacteriota bacterium]